MTKKHFEPIANTIAIRLDAAENEQARTTIIDLAHALAGDFARFNPRFDTTRFLKACGVVKNFAGQ